ncbi:MAG: threonine--tRNA ligase [Verrucomicrobia subdivision 3 bacterium]|nr:threonine--tRNA ligase [Limisphaerales bacterium]
MEGAKNEVQRKTLEERREMDGLSRIRHSCAHVLATAVLRIWPEAKLDIGPPTDEGFYYDFDLEHRFTPDDFEKIEAEMTKVVKENQPFEISEMTRDEAKAHYAKLEQPFKLERINDIPEDEQITFYRNGEFFDLCAGPHVPRTGNVKAFKLLRLAAAYYRGNEKNPQLQRIYGTAFKNKTQLNEWLEMREEAAKRDHRKIGREQGLFTLSPLVGQGLVLWMPKGGIVRSELQSFMQGELTQRGYNPVFTPHIGSIELYKKSGHFPYYKESQYPTITADENEEYLLKPMNCPHHIQIFAAQKHSYRELPIRLAEFGTVYRYEQSGELSGMTRVRGLTQDDAHLFCMQEQVEAEIRDTVDLTLKTLKTLGLDDFRVQVSLREPGSDKYTGDPAHWDAAEATLARVATDMNIPHDTVTGEAAFYGPKLDFMVKDCLGREWQLGTVQLDYNLPERFGLEYVGADNTAHQPVMIHRAPFGSFERFMGILIEHFAGNFPLWLAPEQVRVLPITEHQNEYAGQILDRLKNAGIRCGADFSGNKVGGKIRDAEMNKVHTMLILGKKEQETASVALRVHGQGDQGVKPIEAALTDIQAAISSRSL